MRRFVLPTFALAIFACPAVAADPAANQATIDSSPKAARKPNQVLLTAAAIQARSKNLAYEATTFLSGPRPNIAQFIFKQSHFGDVEYWKREVLYDVNKPRRQMREVIAITNRKRMLIENTVEFTVGFLTGSRPLVALFVLHYRSRQLIINREEQERQTGVRDDDFVRELGAWEILESLCPKPQPLHERLIEFVICPAVPIIREIRRWTNTQPVVIEERP
jgi:hypothetical protein